MQAKAETEITTPQIETNRTSLIGLFPSRKSVSTGQDLGLSSVAQGRDEFEPPSSELASLSKKRTTADAGYRVAMVDIYSSRLLYTR
jgi:hypothetical protein